MKKFQYVVVNPSYLESQCDHEDFEDSSLKYEAFYKAGCICIGLTVLPLFVFLNYAN